MSGPPEDTTAISVTFPAPVTISDEQQRRLVELIDEICECWEDRHPDRVMWAAGIGGAITSMPITAEDEQAGVPFEIDMATLAIDCSERERYETEPLGRERRERMTRDLRYCDRAIDRMGWPEIRAFQSALGQSQHEDAGGYILRKIKALFGIKPDQLETYREAARRLVAEARAQGGGSNKDLVHP